MKNLILALTLLVSLNGFSAKSVVELTDAIVYIPLKGSTATAGYAQFKNTTKQTVDLQIQNAEGFKATETHQTVEIDGRAKMQKVDSFKIMPGESLVLKPGGNHIMLFDPTKDFKEGEIINLEFKVNGKLTKFKFSMMPRGSFKSH